MNDINKILTVHSNQTPPKAGCVLVSEPFIQDIYFSRSVILIAEHEENGSLGFILNKDMEISLNQLDNTFSFDFPVCLGGPVNEDRLFCIHKIGSLIPDSVHIKDDLYFGGNWEYIRKLIADGILNKTNLKICLGYCGWTPGQLITEIENKSWLVSSYIDLNLIFQNQTPDLWKFMVSKEDDSYKHWLNFPINPILN